MHHAPHSFKWFGIIFSNLSCLSKTVQSQHVVLGVGGARDFWDPSEQEFHTPLEIPEPKTRAAKQKVLEQESGAQISTDPLLTLVS